MRTPTSVLRRGVAPGALALALAVAAGRFALAQDGHWELLRPSGQAPQALQWPAYALDAANMRMVLYGGTDQVADQRETWALDLAPGAETWSQLRPAGLAPDAREGASGKYDSHADRMIVFGGYVGERRDFSAETWSLDTRMGAERWSRIASAPGGPTARRGATLVHQWVEDALAPVNRMIMYGGVDADAQMGDVWALDLTPGAEAWHVVSPSGPVPPLRDGHVAVYDASGDRMVVFGGWNRERTTTTLGDLWVLDLTPGREAWLRVEPPGTGPAAVAWAMATTDGCPGNEVMLVFGGYTGQRSSNEVWEITLVPGAERWRRLDVTGARPRPRDSGAMVFDAVARRMVIFSGWDGPGNLLRDSWTLTVGACGAPSPTATGGTTLPSPTATRGPGTSTPTGSPGSPSATPTTGNATATRTLMPVTATTPDPTATPTEGAVTPSVTARPTDSRPCPDAFEPDDATFQAKDLPTDGSVQQRSFHAAGELDYARFQGEAGRTYVIRTTRLGVGVDTRLFLYDSDGITELAANDDDPANAPASRLEWSCAKSGRYYVLAVNKSALAGSCAHVYDLAAEERSGRIYLPITHNSPWESVPTSAFGIRLRATNELWAGLLALHDLMAR